MRGPRRWHRCVLPATLLAAAALLTGCTSSPVGAVATRPAASASAPPAATPAATPTTPPPTQAVADATPVTVRCKKLVPTDVAQQLVPQLTPESGWVPPAGSAAARLADLRGTACAWTDADGDRIEVAVAKPSKADAVALKNDLVRRSNSVPTYGGEAYFRIDGHVGQVDAFRGRTWILARSNRFFEPGDAMPVMAAVDAALGFARSPAPSGSATPGATEAPVATAAPADPAATAEVAPSPTPTP